jgi:ribosomal protein S18 acetylase RimI-like enzyme
MIEKAYTVRPADAEDDAEIAGLVVDGFLEKFRPIFGRRMDRSVRIMERWVRLEHAVGGVRSLVVEDRASSEVVASVGVRTASSDDEALARGLWGALRNNLGFLRASWSATLLSYPRYTAQPYEAYVERLVVSPGYRRRGVARVLLHEAENLARESGKETVGLHVSGSNLPALRLYENEGYGEIDRQRSWLTGHFLGIRDWIYLRKLL